MRYLRKSNEGMSVIEAIGIPLNVATPLALLLSLVALNIAAYTRGWIMPRSTVVTITALHEDKVDMIWKLYETEKVRGDVLEGLVGQLKVVGETQIKILEALPAMKASTT